MKPKIETFERIAMDLGCEPVFPEKENFLIQVIKQLNEGLSFEEGRLVFGGGTCLARAYNIMERFSEDADFRFVSDLKSTKAIRNKITQFMQSLDGFELVEGPGDISTVAKYQFNYSKHPDFTKNKALRPHIQIEIFFSDGLKYPTQRKTICSLYNKYEGLNPETELDCVALEETAIDKISSLLWRIGSDKYHPSDMRHLHDLALLYKYLNIDEKFKAVFKEVYQEDISKRLKTGISLEQSIRVAIDALSEDNIYKEDYKNYVLEMSYAKDSENMTFEQAFEQFEKLVKNLI